MLDTKAKIIYSTKCDVDYFKSQSIYLGFGYLSLFNIAKQHLLAMVGAALPKDWI